MGVSLETGYKSLAGYARRHLEKHLNQLKPDRRDHLLQQFPIDPGSTQSPRQSKNSRRGLKFYFKVVITAGILALVVFYWQKYSSPPSHTPWGHPQGTVFKRHAYTMGYGLNRKLPLWVSFRVTHSEDRESIQGWYRDPEVPSDRQLSNQSISDMGCERKTLIPPRMINVSKKRHGKETRYFSVTVPMVKRLRQGWVHRVENKALEAAKEEPVWLIAGPHLRARGSKPAGFFYIIVRGEPSAPELESYYFAHRDPDPNKEPESARTSLAEIEQRTGLTFFPQLPRNVISERP